MDGPGFDKERARRSVWLLAICLIWLSPFNAPSALGAARYQATDNELFYALTPVDGGVGTLQTHIADITLTVSGDIVTATVDARYRVQNASDQAATIFVRVAPQRLPENTATSPGSDLAGLTLLADGQPLALEAGDNGGATAQVALPADGRADLRLQYTVDLGAGPLVDLRYDGRHLTAWTGERSLRITFALPPEITPDSWLQLSPDGWSDAVGLANGIKWLYDGVLPDAPARLQSVHPTTWARINDAANAARAGGNAQTALALGDLYRILYDASLDAGNSNAADRFFAQAVAAYAAGPTPSAGVDATGAALEAGLAALYRSRIVGPDGRTDPLYAELMTTAAQAAADALPTENPRRQEMLRWQQEGLNLQLIEARKRRDWIGALLLVERLAALPPEVVDAERLAQARRALEIQQALQLLDQGDRDAALALAGDRIADDLLAPPALAQSLFASWQVTMTGGIDGTELHFVAQPASTHEAAALAALNEQVTRWQGTDLPNGIDIQLLAAPGAGGTNAAHLTIKLAPGQSAAPLTTLLSGGPQWALLRTLLEQAGPEIERSGRLFWQETTLRQPLSLAATLDQWRAMAANLQRDAAQFDAAAAVDARDPAGAEAALQSQIQAVNYRNAAQVWEELAQNSWVVTTLAAPSRLETLSRSWMMTVGAAGVGAATQTMEYSAQTVNSSRLILAALAGALGLLLLTGLLWRLL